MKKVIDLFAGCGGFSTGFNQAGFHIVKAVEIDKTIAKSFVRNHKGTSVLVKDISTIDNEDYFSKGDAHVIIGGPPCQGFSMAGARIRENSFKDDPRNYLFKHYLNIVNIVKPDFFIFENVKGLLTMKNGEIFQEIKNSFSNIKNFGGDRYFVSYRVVKSVDFGIPQKRERVIIFGSLNKDINFNQMFENTKNQLYNLNPEFFSRVNVWDAISNLPSPSIDGKVCNPETLTTYQKQLSTNNRQIENHIISNHSPLSISRMKMINNGENWTKLNENIKSVHSGAYGRLFKNEVCPTITTRFDTPSGGRFIHPVENRTLTPREAARIQSFPDSFSFEGGKSSICKQIGNAVPPKLAYFLALVINNIYENVYK